MYHEQRNDTGILFKNNTNGDIKKPVFTGKMKVDGKNKKIALWARTTKNGDTFFTMSIENPYNAGTKLQPQSAPEQFPRHRRSYTDPENTFPSNSDPAQETDNNSDLPF